jgi:hypothetical protein
MQNRFQGSVTVALVTATLFISVAALAASPVQFVCRGPKVDSARKVAKDNNLTLGMDVKACFGEMQLTESARKQIVVAVPAEQCKAGKLLDVYDRSRAGPWYALFQQPVCGTSIAVGPKSPYGDNMITIDGRHYIDKAGAFVPFQGR